MSIRQYHLCLIMLTLAAINMGVIIGLIIAAGIW
jgi:hypothetical protein